MLFMRISATFHHVAFFPLFLRLPEQFERAQPELRHQWQIVGCDFEDVPWKEKSYAFIHYGVLRQVSATNSSFGKRRF